MDAGTGPAGKPATPVSPGIAFLDPLLKSQPQVAITPEPVVGTDNLASATREILDQLPTESIKPPNSFDSSRAIILNASDIEKGMASGKPSVPLVSIYQQAPEIFTNSVTPGDVTNVALPFTKVLEQFSKLQVRPDQEHDVDVPQLETPILKVTLEDTERFGTDIEPLQTSPLPPVKVEPATAKTIAAAEPEPAARSAARPKIALRDLEPLISAGDSPTAPDSPPTSIKEGETDVAPTPAPKKIPFHLPPNGTGAPASETVPASSGPPVPTIADIEGSTTTKKEPAPGSIVAKEPIAKIPDIAPKKTASGSEAASGIAPTAPPFKFRAPSNDLRPKRTLVPGVEPKETPPTAEAIKPAGTNEQVCSPPNVEPKIVLSLQSLLSQLPAFQLNGSPSTVPEGVQVIFPLSLIQPQLASGRVVIPARTFQRAIPEAHRGIFMIDPNETPVSLPLDEIVKHLPPAALRMRDDQDEATPSEKFTTPFSIQAEEDARRFSASTGAVQKTTVETEKKAAEEKNIAQTKETPTFQAEADAPKESTVSRFEAASGKAAQKEPEPPKLDAKSAAIRAKELPGVASCAITFADGLGLAGNISAELAAEGLSAMAPSLLHKIESNLSDTKLGTLRAMTLHCSEATVTFLRHGNICLTAQHSEGEDLSAETRAELSQLTQELSQTYPEVELSHVDH